MAEMKKKTTKRRRFQKDVTRAKRRSGILVTQSPSLHQQLTGDCGRDCARTQGAQEGQQEVLRRFVWLLTAPPLLSAVTLAREVP
jgi:Flp pilus assembly protein TadB